ncbi:non-hydrolyzing UDP-N-acetylglucosamine 2-epimerase [Listeria booriae]|uniref:non-hydrolyzing UDP-N-acetylglucosamine 2-epimerase n=1 Tax=Listeria booriae TaxID=1552123 RepID=UPI001623D162|nr:UDP-N-acetylglucosamine 2-epimerase (non-hydrolyzing) [Listeria booriae]MBC2322470.1 UDP-N-acetylglucosamine 2-epimerase (non-hydrolyzing) [Listeria booriae]MCD2206523.1 UDP-N-acetylglucosamine 2-epimerase (non-hydrolyzing) [Listeria booriae]
MKPFKIMSIFGTRPEAIKMAPIIKELEQQQDIFESIVVVTGQHREMLEQVLASFGITPDYNLDIMAEKQTLESITALSLNGLSEIIAKERPHMVLVHGDTTTSFAGGLAAFYNQVPLGHVEAGLRTHDKYSPFPEEINRGMTGVLADLHFAPTVESAKNLLKENKSASNIFVTGNTAIDALKTTISDDYTHPLLEQTKHKKMILLTCHRRENLNQAMDNIFAAVNEVTRERDDVAVIFPVHLNPEIREKVAKHLYANENVHLIGPLETVDFHNIANHADFIMTDSGGVQEEAPSLDVPVLVLRDNTERPEGVDAGTLKVIGTNKEDIKIWMNRLLDDDILHKKMSLATNPYGDGHAATKILTHIHRYLTEQSKLMYNCIER